MAQRPNKPKNYVRDYTIICVIGFSIGLFFIFLGIKYLPVLFAVGFVSFAPLLWFREYHKALRDYNEQEKQELIEREFSSSQRDVNQNIENYLANQRMKRANKKWWQFWI